MAKHKHLTEDERARIESALKAGESYKGIGAALGRDPTTIKKEVSNHLEFLQTGCVGNPFNDCLHRFKCKQRYLCVDNDGCRRHSCRGCKFCRKMCDLYEKEVCRRLEKPPFVCNGCDARHKCTLEKRVYNSMHAQREYRSLLGEARSGIDADEAAIARLDAIVSPLLKKGQSLHVIHENHKDELMVSEKTLYNYVEAGLFGAGPLDMPRVVRYRKRKTKAKQCKVDNECRRGREYADCLAYVERHPGVHTVQMDSVEGRKGGAVLLTLHFPDIKFMLAFRRAANDAASVKDRINVLYESLGDALFRKLFPLLLGDRGSEFSDPKKIEFTSDGEERCRVFYCDAGRSDQKGALEKNHEHIRTVIPKGVPMECYDQSDIALMMNHVNSYSRNSIGDATPFDMFVRCFGDEAAKKLGLERIAPDDVNLTPSLLKKKKL